MGRICNSLLVRLQSPGISEEYCLDPISKIGRVNCFAQHFGDAPRNITNYIKKYFLGIDLFGFSRGMTLKPCENDFG